MFTNPEFWIAVSFVIAIAILLKLAGNSFLGALDAHGARIAGQLDEARKLREEAEALLAEQQRRQRDAINDAKDIIAHAHSEAERITGEAAAELERSLRLRELHARERIAISEIQAVAEVRKIIVDIAIEAARRALAEHLDESSRVALIDRSIADIGRYIA
jgi:F-type H+-transporting ATPase subunit b